jgi:hypothetical protein
MKGVYQDPNIKNCRYIAEPLTKYIWKLTKHDESEQYMCRIKTDNNGQQSFHSIQMVRDSYKTFNKPVNEQAYFTTSRQYVNPTTCKLTSIHYVVRPILVIPLEWKVNQ